MLYGIQLSVLDFAWAIISLVAVVGFGLSVHFKWIRSGVLTTFLIFKLGVGLSFTVSAVLNDVEFDAAGYYNVGSVHAAMLRDMFTGVSTEYLHNTPFWWVDGISTDRFMSLTGLFLVLTGGSFLGATAIACMFGAAGQLLLYRFFRERFPEVRAVYFLPVLFHPSLMLWSGMLLKDSIGIFALGGAVYTLHLLLGKRQLAAFVPFALSFYTIFLFRSFIFLPLSAFMLFMVWDRVVLPYTGKKSEGGLLRAMYIMAAATACILVIAFLFRSLAADLIESRRESAALFSQIEAGSSFQNVDLSFSPAGALALGMGVINSLFRPFPWDVAKPIQAAAAGENLAMLVYFWIGFRCYFRRLTSHQREQFSGLFWGMLVVALIIATGVGLFASNSGTISRYRIPMIPFLVAVPGLALGMADRFSRSDRGHNAGNSRRHPGMPRRRGPI